MTFRRNMNAMTVLRKDSKVLKTISQEKPSKFINDAQPR